MSSPTKKAKCDGSGIHPREDYCHIFVSDDSWKYSSFMIPMSVFKDGDREWLSKVHGKNIEDIHKLKDNDPAVRAFFEVAVGLGVYDLEDVEDMDRSLDTKHFTHKTADWKEYKWEKPGTFTPCGNIMHFVYFNNIGEI